MDVVEMLEAASREPGHPTGVNRERFTIHLSRQKRRRTLRHASVTAVAVIGLAATAMILSTRPEREPGASTPSTTTTVGGQSGYVPVDVLAVSFSHSQVPVEFPRAGTTTVLRTAEDAGTIWREWRLPGGPPERATFSSNFVVGFVVQDEPCPREIRGLTLEEGVASLDWGRSRSSGCEQPMSSSAYVVSIDRAHVRTPLAIEVKSPELYAPSPANRLAAPVIARLELVGP